VQTDPSSEVGTSLEGPIRTEGRLVPTLPMGTLQKRFKASPRDSGSIQPASVPSRCGPHIAGLEADHIAGLAVLEEAEI